MRYAFGTYNLLLNTFDHPPKRKMKKIMRELYFQFPGWEKNGYYLDRFNKKTRKANHQIFIQSLGIKERIKRRLNRKYGIYFNRSGKN